MKAQVVTLDNKKEGEIELKDAIFGLPVREDLIARCIQWQRDKARSGTHKTKTISDIQGTTKKPWRQKGTGHARQGSLRSPQFRGGATIFGPVVRDHGYSLPKKVRKLALKTALSAKLAEGNLHIIAEARLPKLKTKSLVQSFEKLGLSHALIIDGPAVDEAFARAARNIRHIDVLPTMGANVYDIIRHKQLVLTAEAVKLLEERLK